MMTVILAHLDVVVIFVDLLIPITQHVFTFVPCGICRFLIIIHVLIPIVQHVFAIVPCGNCCRFLCKNICSRDMASRDVFT